MKSVSMKGFDNLVSSSSLGERYPFERITQVVFITAKIAFIFTSLSAVQIYDFQIFTVVYSVPRVPLFFILVMTS